MLARLTSLRSHLQRLNVSAMIVGSEDAHLSEYVSETDQRRKFISGFTGSAGTALVTMDKALLWTDGRYFLQAGQQLTEEWELMRMGEEGVPSLLEYLLTHCRNQRIGVDDLYISYDQASAFDAYLKKVGSSLVPLAENPVDLVWGEEKPVPTPSLIKVHSLAYAGESVPDKLQRVRDEMVANSASLLLLSALDEIAWLFNIRGSDIQFNPVVISYAVVTLEDVYLFVDPAKLGNYFFEEEKEGGEENKANEENEENEAIAELRSHLRSVAIIHPYDTFFDHLPTLIESSGEIKFMLEEEEGEKTQNKEREGSVGLVWVDTDNVNWKLGSAVPRQRKLTKVSPIQLMKSVKNQQEVDGMRQAHVYDGVALTAFFCWLESEIAKRESGSGSEEEPLTECSVSDTLESFRAKMPGFVSLSFDTISGVGGNGAIIHYKPEPETCAQVTPNSLLLLDSGGQYVNGTTDITRTVWLGEGESPSPFIVNCFTRVLKGHIALAKVKCPKGTLGTHLDPLARASLWEVGLDYRHGTGHGVGAFLNVHEGPQRITFRKSPNEEGFQAGMITSNEPGYYHDGEFGIRIENLTACQVASTEHTFGNKEYLEFDTISLCPIQRKLIDEELLTFEEKKWLNDYHQTVREKLEPVMREHFPEAVEYLIANTESI